MILETNLSGTGDVSQVVITLVICNNFVVNNRVRNGIASMFLTVIDKKSKNHIYFHKNKQHLNLIFIWNIIFFFFYQN